MSDGPHWHQCGGFAGLALWNQMGGLAVLSPSATRNRGCHTMSKRPPYVEIIVTAVVMAFLTLVVVGGFDARNESFGQISMSGK